MATKKSSAKTTVKVRNLPQKKNAKGGAPASPSDITIAKPTNSSSSPIMH
ncbi:MAG: hypothetical protein ACJ8LI_04505 [Chthoniobacterales bacterium]